jgi:hypothetical protein
MKLAVIDIESSGLFDNNPDCCILELAVAIVYVTPRALAPADRFVVLDVEKWLVAPPDVDGPRSFAAWERRFEKEQPFVFKMHSTEYDGSSLLADLRQAGGGRPHEIIDAEAAALLEKHRATEFLTDGTKPPEPERILFTGNSIANLDMPLVRKFLPRLHAAMHYRIMDVSVLKTWMLDIMDVPLPKEIAVAISKGIKVEQAGRAIIVETHRAYDDVTACIDQLRAISTWTRATLLDGLKIEAEQ